MKAKLWLAGWAALVVSGLSVFGYWVYTVDPYFHYHKPDVDRYFYALNNQRSQNDGICRHFDYDALITGTSMTENFRTTEADAIFGRDFIKVPYSGGSFAEINDNIERALAANPKLKTVIRSLDMDRFFDPSDMMRDDLGEYPSYLYDNNPFNDVEYLLNREIFFNRVYQMLLAKDKPDFKAGITTFDEYSRWQESCLFGIDTVSPEGIICDPAEQVHLTAEQKETIKENVDRNVLRTADTHPDVDFYYFYTPYSAAAWNDWKNTGSLCLMLETEEFITELIVPHKNIHLFSFNGRTDITTDLNNYRDPLHYAAWINSLMLKWMHDDQYRLTEENYKERLKQEYNFYTTFDYASLNGQEDYGADNYAGALLNKELTGASPLDILNDPRTESTLNGAAFLLENERRAAVDCCGAPAEGNGDAGYSGIRFEVDLGEGYRYLSFYGQKLTNAGQPAAYVYGPNGNIVVELEMNGADLDHGAHQYVLDLSAISGTVTIVLDGGYNGDAADADPYYRFSNICMY